jgi:hypothetical protein
LKKIETQPWWPKLVAKKDERSLRQLSDEFGASPAAISNALKRNKLTRKAAPSGPRKKAAPSGPQKKAAPSGPRKKAGARVAAPKRTRKAASKRAATRRAKAPSRVKTPATAKAQTRVKTPATAKAQTRVKTPATAKATTGKRARRTRRSTLSQYRNEMGKVVDRIIAEKAGVTVSAVTNYRRRHNIPAHSGRGRPRSTPRAQEPTAKTPSAAVTPKVRATVTRATQYAFRVRIGDKKIIVVAKDIADAARVAMASKKGSVSRIRLIGPALT